MSKQNQGQQFFSEVERAADAYSESSKRPAGMPILSVIKTETSRLGFPDSDAEYIYDAWMASGFKDVKGRKIHDWRASIRNWARNGWLHSQRNGMRRMVDPKEQEARALDELRRMAERRGK